MDNIVVCPDCGKTFIAEEEHTHQCRFSIVQIPILHFYTVKKDGEEVVIAKGKNGKYYYLAKRPITELPTDFSQKDTANHRVHRTPTSVLLR